MKITSTWTGQKPETMFPKIQNMIACLTYVAPPGPVVEVGVYRGGSLGLLASKFPSRKFYGFDTFTGHPETCSIQKYHCKGNFGDTSYEKVKQELSEYSNIELIQGCFPESDTIGLQSIALAHVDVDTYESSLNTLRYLHDRMAPGGFLFCDDAFQKNCDGATLAMCQYAAEYRKIIRLAQLGHAFIEY